jgi:low temperature requirement protein LtrA
MAQHPDGPARIRAVRRDGEQVTPLELFFDLVFVLALTQCTEVMVERPSWAGVGQAMLLLGLLWWAWVGYAWLTSVLDPEEGSVRLMMFAAMGAFLVAALAVPQAFDDEAMTLALALVAFRVAHIGLFWLASRGEAELRHSVAGLAVSSALAGGLVVVGALVSGDAREWIWLLALVVDMGGPYLFGIEGWQLVPRHFAERHGLIIIIALGESVVAIGVGAGVALSARVIVGAVLGLFLAAGLWWAYFDVASIVAARRLAELPKGKEQNGLARDAYSYLHFPMVAGIVLVAFGLHETLAHVDGRLHLVPAAALGGGVALYLLAHVAFKRRGVGIWSIQRVVTAALLIALIPLWHQVDSVVALAGVLAILIAMLGFETVRYAEARAEERRHLHEHELDHDPGT